MVNIHKMIFVVASASVLLACGSGGSGSGATGANTGTNTGGITGPTAPVNSVFQGAKNLGGAPSGTATYDATNAKYIYNFNGTDIDVTLPGVTDGHVVDITAGGNKQMVGGATYAYSRFGVIGPVGNLDAGEVFYVGQKTVNMPTSGTAVYKGFGIGLPSGSGAGSTSFAYAPATFYVNFGVKTISGQADNSAARFNQATITGNSFAGTLSNGTQGGSYAGHFFGPAAEELGGIGKFNIDVDGNDNDVFSFGAKKQ